MIHFYGNKHSPQKEFLIFFIGHNFIKETLSLSFIYVGKVQVTVNIP